MTEPAPQVVRGGAWDGLGLGLLVGALLVAARPVAVHDDALVLLGASPLPSAVAATPLGAAWRWCTAHGDLVGLAPYAAGLGLGGLAVAVALVAVHAAAREAGFARGRAALAVLLFAVLPSVAIAAVRLQPLVLVAALAAVATWLAARAARGSAWTGLALGAVLALAHCASPVGALTWLVALPWCGLAAAGAPAGPTRWPWRALAVAVGVGAVGVAWGTWGRPLAGMPTYEMVRSYDLGTLAPLVARDAGRSFLPLSLLVPAALLSAAWHRHALVLVLAAAVGTLLGCHLTGTLGDDGAFLLPLAPAAAVLVAGWLPPRAGLAAAALGLVLAGTKVALHLQWSEPAAFTAAVERVRADRPCRLVLGPRRDETFVLARGLPAAVHGERLLPLVAAGAVRSAAAVRDELLAHARAGGCVAISDEAEVALRDAFFRAAYPGAPALLNELDAAFVWRNVVELGFAGHELVPR